MEMPLGIMLMNAAVDAQINRNNLAEMSKDLCMCGPLCGDHAATRTLVERDERGPKPFDVNQCMP